MDRQYSQKKKNQSTNNSLWEELMRITKSINKLFYFIDTWLCKAGRKSWSQQENGESEINNLMDKIVVER